MGKINCAAKILYFWGLKLGYTVNNPYAKNNRMTYLLPILGVLTSFLFVYLTRPKNKENFKLLLAFSGAFLLSLTMFELLPQVYGQADAKTVGVFIMLGILLQIFLEFFSKGAEHGHVHLNHETDQFPWLLFISLSLHSFLEGFPVEDNHTLIYGILVHKIPIAIILGIFLLGSKLKLWQSVFFIVLFSLMTPLGSFVAANFSFATAHAALISSLVIGIFLHISTVILFESSEGHKFNLRKLLVIMLAIAIAYLL